MIMVILMASINIPLFIYSRSFLKSEQPVMETLDMHGAPVHEQAGVGEGQDFAQVRRRARSSA